MTCLPVETDLRLEPVDRHDQIRAAVFWGFILAVIVSPFVLGLVVLAQG
jgi:hypothetical protein